MHLLEAAAAIQVDGTRIEASGLYNKYGRFYKVYEPGSGIPPVWMSVAALIRLAELQESLTEE